MLLSTFIVLAGWAYVHYAADHALYGVIKAMGYNTELTGAVVTAGAVAEEASSDGNSVGTVMLILYFLPLIALYTPAMLLGWTAKKYPDTKTVSKKTFIIPGLLFLGWIIYEIVETWIVYYPIDRTVPLINSIVLLFVLIINYISITSKPTPPPVAAENGETAPAEPTAPAATDSTQQ